MKLIYDFIKNQQFSTYELAETIVQELFRQNISEELIANIFSLYLQKEIDSYSDPIDAFRSGTLASDLHIKYCTALFQSRLHQLGSILSIHWNKTLPIMFSLSYAEMNPFAKIDIEENCKTLFLEFIGQLYKLSLDPLCERLLRNWRKEIYRHFLKTQSPAEASLTSETQGEIFFLRIINPYLMTMTKEPYKKELLTHVAKMIQALANQIPPVNLLEPFHDVYNHFIPVHRAYINRLFGLD